MTRTTVILSKNWKGTKRRQSVSQRIGSKKKADRDEARLRANAEKAKSK